MLALNLSSGSVLWPEEAAEKAVACLVDGGDWKMGDDDWQTFGACWPICDAVQGSTLQAQP